MEREDRLQANTVVTLLRQGEVAPAVEQLRKLKAALYANIPDRQRQSRGITWVLQQISNYLAGECSHTEEIPILAEQIYTGLAPDDELVGIPIFLMAEYGKVDPSAVLDFFVQVAGADDWMAREFAAGGFRKMIHPGREIVFPWLRQTAQSQNPNLRRFVSETLRPVSENRWLQKEPETSLSILRLLFREAHPYPRTSVGNNLSDLARRNSDLIKTIVSELVANGDANSYWIAYRACRNMVKVAPQEIMDLLGVDEYHYKDRNFYRDQTTGDITKDPFG